MHPRLAHVISSRRPLPRRIASAAAVGLALIVCGVLWSRTSVPPLSEFDQTFYIGIAYDLRSTGRFTDGFVFASGDAQKPRPQGMRFAPLYPGRAGRFSIALDRAQCRSLRAPRANPRL